MRNKLSIFSTLAIQEQKITYTYPSKKFNFLRIHHKLWIWTENKDCPRNKQQEHVRRQVQACFFVDCVPEFPFPGN